MSEPWNQESWSPPDDVRRRRSVKNILGQLVDVVFFSGIVYVAIIKHYYVNRQNS